MRQKVPQEIRSEPHLTTPSNQLYRRHKAVSSFWFVLPLVHFVIPVWFSLKTTNSTNPKMPIIRNDSLPVLERIEQKRASVKYRLNELVDDLFSYLTSELTEHLAVPPDRVTVLINQQQEEEEQHQDRNLEASSRSAVVVDLSLPSMNDQQKEHENIITNNSSNQDVEEEEARSPIRLPTSNKLPVIVNNCFSKEHNNSFSKTTPTTPTSTASSERPPQGTRASSEPPHPRMAALQQADDQNLFPLPSTSSSTFEASSSGGIFVPTVPDDLLMDDLDDADEHSDSDCDCEQCMGVPICKVDLDEVVKIRRDLKVDDSSDRPSKKARTSATLTSLSSSASGATTSSANAYSSPPTSPLSTEAIADLQEDFHLQEMVAVGEQCSATFKTISIKCSRDDCRSMFKNKVERNQHLQTVHGTQPYTCLMQHCSLGFDNV